ncbi:Hypothetical predicted protein [Mytilus galloprovincialis]|uniref:Uncharacterized protein n=1 Tax=Mytilus galloprovincialis TaxID=29158 RepID=A0A8B6CE42_MYTGA|nr:Hypothetical predicted protein [Mytilus galloprovincialis]
MTQQQETSLLPRNDKKTHYDQKVKGAVLKPGDRVLVKTLAFDGKHKLADRQRRKKQPEEPTKSEGNSENRTTDEVSDEESEQEYGYYILDQDTQDNTNSDVPVVDLQEEGTLGFTGDGHDGAESSDQQGTGLGGDALPVDINTAAEPNPVSDEEPEEATAQTTEENTSIDQDESAPTDLSLEEADEPTIAPEQQQRRRRILPTPPRDPPVATRPQRERKPPKYLEDYVVSKQATTIQQPDWLMRIHWLESEARKGRFKGLEMELSRTILDIMRTRLMACRGRQPSVKGETDWNDVEVIFLQRGECSRVIFYDNFIYCKNHLFNYYIYYKA